MQAQEKNWNGFKPMVSTPTSERVGDKVVARKCGGGSCIGGNCKKVPENPFKGLQK
jgi:hypothetical protein